MKIANSGLCLSHLLTRFSWLIIVIVSFTFSACMMAGMHKFGRSNDSELTKPQELNESDLTDQLIAEAIIDLSGKPELVIESLAVWKIETQSASSDAENIRQKIITALVNNTSYKIISREHLDEILAEQSLSLSGVIDSSNAAKIGNLIGVEGFVTGYFSKTKDRINLSLNIIETNSGQVIWSATQWRSLNERSGRKVK